MLLLRKIGFPFSLIYALVVYLRNFFYDHKIFSSKSFKTPTVCVGNLSVGGTGKTPMTELLIRILKGRKKLAVLSRGYRRKTKGFILASEDSTAEQIGDEPLQIASKFPEVPLAVEANRRKGIALLEEKVRPDLILLDDAYQHRRVKPDFSILLTAYENRYTKDWYLPSGTLRDSKKEARRANLIVVTKCPPNISEGEQADIINEIKPLKHQKVLFCYFAYDKNLKGHKNGVSLDDLKDKKVTLVTGVANPNPLVRFLESEGITLEHLQFRDHHYFTEREIDLFNSRPFVLTTEKDYTRSKGKVNNLYYISVSHEFIGDGQKVLEKQLAQL